MSERPFAKGYSDAGASHNRRALKGFTARSSSPREDIDWNQYTLRQRGRMLYMSSPLATSAIKTNRTKIVGTGLMLKSSVDAAALRLTPEAAKDWQRNTEKEFALWADKRQNCDAIGVNNFYGMQQLAVVSWLTSGDVFGMKQWVSATDTNPYQLRIRMIEADRVSTPLDGRLIAGGLTEGRAKNGNPIYDGVEVDKRTGQIVAYWVCNMYPDQFVQDASMRTWQRVRAFGRRTGEPLMLHVMDTERPDQYRGVTYLAPVIEYLLNISRYNQAELLAATVQSFFTAFIYTETNPAEIPMNEVGYGPDESPDRPPDSYVSENPNEHEMGPGTMIHLKPGEKVEFGEPKIPVAGHEAFIRVMAKLTGAALELPYDTIMKEFNASYSASRAAIMEAWEAVAMRRSWLVSSFCQPVYEAWLTEAVAIGRIKAPGFFTDPRIRAAWCGAQWLGPVQGQLDPLKEVRANILAAGNAFKTHAQIAREYGGSDWQANAEELGNELNTLRDIGAIVTPDDGGDEDEQENDNQ